MMISAFNVISFQVPKASAQYELNVFMQPGVADPYNPGFSLTLGTLRTHPDYIVATQNAFSILADSVGDLQFTFTVNTAVGYIQNLGTTRIHLHKRKQREVQRMDRHNERLRLHQRLNEIQP